MTEVTIKEVVGIFTAGMALGYNLACTLDNPAETADVWAEAKAAWLASGEKPEYAHYLIEELKAWWPTFLGDRANG